MNIYDGRIVEIEKNVHSITFIKQGIPVSEQHKYRNFPGGNGTVVVGGEYVGITLDLKIYLFDSDILGIPKIINVDIRNYVLQKNSWKNLTQDRLDDIVDKNRGKKVKVYKTSSGWELFDYSKLKI